MKKILILIILTIVLSGCSSTIREYSFDDRPISYTPNKDYEKYIYGGIMDKYDENSSL